MAQIVGGIGVSHTPTIGFAVDRDLEGDPSWSPVFRNLREVRDWIVDRDVDALFVIYNDHVTSFFFDHYSAFALGVDDSYKPADEGGGARDLPPIAGHAEFARHIGHSLMASEFDLAFFRDRPLDHGCFSPLSLVNMSNRQWIAPIVPLQVGVLQYPIPTAQRCYRLGRALRRAVLSYPEDIRVAIVGTGGLSHQVHGERSGFNNPDWDHEFLSLIETDPEALTRMTHAELAARGGAESVEIIMWLVMRGALSDSVNKVQQSYFLPSMTAIATLILEDEGSAAQDDATAVDPYEQMHGIDAVPGTYPFSLERLSTAYKLNAFLHDLVDPEWRGRFKEDPERHMEEAGLSSEDRDLIRRSDWRGLIHRGATFFVLEKLGVVTGVSNLDIYAGMKNISLEEMLATRNEQITYSVAGKSSSS